MTSTTFILVAGCAIFAVTTLAALWTGYLLMQRLWVAENADLLDKSDLIRPLFNSTYAEQPDGPQPAGGAISDAPVTP